MVPHEEWGLPKAEPPFPAAPAAAAALGVEAASTTPPRKSKKGPSSKGAAAVVMQHDAKDAAAHLKVGVMVQIFFVSAVYVVLSTT